MKWLELLNMEYGECVVLGGGDRSLLMVDCGSVSQKLREGDVPLDAWLETIAARYEPAMERWFLLTHFHRDHLSGFQKLLESREGYFSRVFLPRTPVDSHGVPLLLEYALFAYLFLGETLSAMGLLGAAVIVGTVVAATWADGRTGAPAAPAAPVVVSRRAVPRPRLLVSKRRDDRMAA